MDVFSKKFKEPTTGFRSWLNDLKDRKGVLNTHKSSMLRFFADIVAAHPTALLPIDPANQALGGNRATFAPHCDPAQPSMTGDMLLLASPASGIFASAVVKGPALINNLCRPGFHVYGSGSNGRDTHAMLLPIQLLEVYAHTPPEQLPLGRAPQQPSPLPPTFEEVSDRSPATINYMSLLMLAATARGSDVKPSGILSNAINNMPVAVGQARTGPGPAQKRSGQKKTSFTNTILNEAFVNSIARPDCAWIVNHCCC